MQVHSTVIPRFTVGGRLTFHNMTAFVFDDADYTFAQSRYQVQGVLGYPALSALSSLTITDNATIELRPVRQIQAQGKAAPNYDGARFFLDGDQIIVALGLAPNEQMFALDAAGQQTYFTSRYYDEHAVEFAGQKTENCSRYRVRVRFRLSPHTWRKRFPAIRIGEGGRAFHPGAHAAGRLGCAGRCVWRAGRGRARPASRATHSIIRICGFG